MSAYGKTPPQQPEYDTRPSQGQQLPNPQQPSYPNYSAQPHYAAPAPPPSHIPHSHSQSAPPSTALSGSPFHSRPFHEQEPQVTGYHPLQGTEGTMFYVYLQSSVDLTTDPRNIRFMFGSRRCNTSLQKSEGRVGQYYLTGHVPAFSLTGWVAPQVNVFLNIEDGEGQALGTVEVGPFTFTDVSPQQTYSSPTGGTRKRKNSVDADDLSLRSPAKRPTSQPIRPKSEDYGAYGYQTHGTSPYPPYAPNQGQESNYRIYPYEQEQSQAASYQPQTSPRNFSYNNYPASAEAPPAPPAPPPPSAATSAQAWPQPAYPIHATNSQAASGQSQSVSRSSGVENSPSQTPGTLPSPSDGPAPTLIRTSTLQQGAHTPALPGQPLPSANASVAGFNPYGIYPHKAILKVQGELNDMAKQWSAEEWENRRRLVQFWRQQKGSTIHTTFLPVAPNDRQPNSICISCIWWAEKTECFVTSVDCIYLLESLIAVRFTVEEKNRIRRNLEGFRPLTVSKAKPDSESFFKLIMAFPNPKPRNIEKDVKVFPWGILAHALKKIIGKYSASYSSTASVIPTAPGASAYPGHLPGESSQPSPQDNNRATVTSPKSAANSTSSDPSTGLTARIATPPIKPSPDSPPMTRTGGSSDLSAHVAALPPPTTGHSLWQSQQTISQVSQSSAHREPRTSWDMAAFLDTSPGTATPVGGQAVHYQRVPVAGEDRESAPVTGQSGKPLTGDGNVP